ncbi:hypothetical protein LC040_03885 [Bacillus tianshenii]|nr:hypothetical protein LC040_03885 [Bacillus tianshenii]
MKKLITFLLELVRVIVLFGLLLTLFGWLNEQLLIMMTGTSEIRTSLGLLQAIGFLLVIIVLYRNKLQFHGWFKSGDERPLSKKATKRLLMTAGLLIALPYALGLIS